MGAMPRLPAAALSLLLLASAAPGGDEAFRLLQDGFPERVAQRGEPADRANWILRVAGFDSADGARLLMVGLGALGDRIAEDLAAYEKTRKEYEPLNVPLDVKKDNYKTRTELQNRLMQMDAWLRDDTRVLETFRDGIRKFNDAKSLSTLAAEARKLKAERVRETAAEGLAGNPGGLEAAIRLGQEKDPVVQAAVLRGMKGRKEEPVFAFALESLKSESWPVRLEAVGALEGLSQARVLMPLIQALAREEGRLREDIRDALRRLTSQNFDAEPDAWKRWYIDNHETFEGPKPDAALFGAFKGGKGPPEKKSVYGIESRSRRIIFVIDTSGSMKERITKAAGTPTGLSGDELEALDATKIDIAKKELKRAIRALENGALFNIVSFGSSIVTWKPTMVRKDDRNDIATFNEALTFVTDMEAAGGTWTYGALQEAFRLGGMGVTDRSYDPAADTFYLISDGAPTNNDMDKPEAQDPKIILDAVREWNRLGKVVIHAVAIDPRAAGGRFVDFMKRLAAQNDGQYTQRE